MLEGLKGVEKEEGEREGEGEGEGKGEGEGWKERGGIGKGE